MKPPASRLSTPDILVALLCIGPWSLFQMGFLMWFAQESMKPGQGAGGLALPILIIFVLPFAIALLIGAVGVIRGTRWGMSLVVGISAAAFLLGGFALFAWIFVLPWLGIPNAIFGLISLVYCGLRLAEKVGPPLKK